MIDLHQPLPGKRPGKITPVGYAGIVMGAFFVAIGLFGLQNSPETVGGGFFSLTLGAAIIYLCYMGVRR